jgi:thiopurine S-methyltransferase
MAEPTSPASAAFWDGRYRSGGDRWELGAAAPVLADFLADHPWAPEPPGTVLVPGCGRGHEARLLAERGFDVVGLDFSSEALAEARRIPFLARGRLAWVQADLFDRPALTAAGLLPGSLAGVVEHTCFCAIDPGQRQAYINTVVDLLAPGGWLLALFWCHAQPGGPPFGADPGELEQRLRAAGLTAELWQPAPLAAQLVQRPPRQDEWLGFWRKNKLLEGLDSLA